MISKSSAVCTVTKVKDGHPGKYVFSENKCATVVIVRRVRM